MIMIMKTLLNLSLFNSTYVHMYVWHIQLYTHRIIVEIVVQHHCGKQTVSEV